MKFRTTLILPLVGTTALLAVAQLKLQAAAIADSKAEFSGIQGKDGWYYGYRNVASGAPADYDPASEFLSFPGGEGQGAWDGFTQFWTGTQWDMNTAGAAPWTYIGSEGIHPNGFNNGEEHWAIRRWAATELTADTWLGVQWNVRKQNAAGAGVTGALHVNGIRRQSAAIAGNNTNGVTQTYWVKAKPTDLFDLILSPVGPSGDTGDGSDGSYNWMVVTSTGDTDSDGLADAWEELYFPGDLTKLSGTGDFDGDGLKDVDELAKGTDPTKADTDNDGLVDGAETDTGLFVSATNTGTSPSRADTDGDGRKDGEEVNGTPTSNPNMFDTDGDGYSDGAEVATGHNPNDPNNNIDTTWIAHSRLEFSTDGNQGANDWFGGYRNFTADGGGLNYNADRDFIPFTVDFWDGAKWDLAAGTSPWTELGPEGTHPAGASPTHWTIRRWVATELTKKTPLSLRWHVRKTNTGGGNGVTGGLYIDGQRVDAATIAGNNGTGITHTFYANVDIGQKIDLILSPRGADNSDQDGYDGSANWLVIDPNIPANPVQPDGTVFIPVGAGDTDADGMPDVWEKIFFPNDLTKLTATGDYEGDGLKDVDEYKRDSDPTKPDTDADGLSDLVETGTGKYVSPTDTGSSPKKADTDGDGLSDFAEVTRTPAPTDPNKADTDGDGFSDPAEIDWGTDPLNAADNPLAQVIANSENEFSGIQGQDGWRNGYRVYNPQTGTIDYDAAQDFIPFPGGSDNAAAWDGTTQTWTGSAWDLNTAGAGPWTYQARLDVHPNGTNSPAVIGGTADPTIEQWVIRRWTAAEVTQETPVAVIWHARKGAAADTGVTGSLHVNGKQVDHRLIPGSDTTGQIRRYYVNLKPNDIVDLALTPEGSGGDRHDYSDGSSTWFWVDKKIPKEPRQPDGTLFIPAGAPDSDADGLLDFWELIYAADLTVLTGTGDNDSDGLNNSEEFARDSNPLMADTDGDGLGDAAESNTGTFVSATNTGTNPRKTDTDGDGRTDGEEVNGTPKTDPNKADTDGDGFSDGAEVATGHNPNDANNNPNTTWIADSRLEFSTDGSQGANDWYGGYRNFSADGGAINYNANTDFIPFTQDLWMGAKWDLDLGAGGAPWTELAAQDTHPNGSNSGGVVHWTVRRWVAAELTKTTPLAIRWHVHKSNTGGGNGVTGALHIDGQRVDSVIIAGTDGTGVTHTFYANVAVGQKIDLILSPRGQDNADNDGADGSINWMIVDPTIPPNPVQPDGTVFIPVGSQIILASSYNAAQGQLTLTWNAVPGSTYTVWGTADLKTWTQVQSGITTGSHTIQIGTSPGLRFYRVSQP